MWHRVLLKPSTGDRGNQISDNTISKWRGELRQVSYSIDNGQQFSALPMIDQKQADGTMKKVAAPVSMYTQVRGIGIPQENLQEVFSVPACVVQQNLRSA